MPTPTDPILTTFQIELLKAVSKSRLQEIFFLTGGTALAAFYLHHRLSEDLDFFTEEEGAVSQVAPLMERVAKDAGASLKITRQFSSFLEMFATSPEGEIVKIDFARDAPFRLQPLKESPWGVQIDNPLDISCNKLSALFERAAAKDFIDIYFIVQELYSFEDLLTQARKKHVGLDPYWLAVAFRQVEKIDQWPTMKRPCDFDQVRRFFLEKARQLIEK